MKNWKFSAIIVLLIILTGVIISSLIPKPLQKADPQTRGQTNNPPLSAVSKEGNAKQADPTTSSAPVYMTQEQQDARQHKWGKPNLPGVDKARQNGAEAKVTLRVIDSRGAPVPGADIQMAFFPKDSYEAAKITKGLTDKDGLFVVSGKTVDDISFSASKADYYVTSRKFHFYWRGTACVKNGRWQPWNPTLEVVLKEKRKPIPMYQNFVETVMPAGTNRLGFDFLVGDWVAPHGKGNITDMWYVYDENFIDRDNFYIKLSFAFEGEKNGCYMRKMDNYSGLISEHEASDIEFAPSKVCVIEQEKGKYTKELRFAEDDYMVFRIRTKTDEQGKIVSSHYGKIYGPVGVPHRWSKKFSFTYYLNPTPNDRNVEYDPQKNLIPDGQRHAMNRNLP